MYKAMIEGVTLPMLVVDSDGRIIFANKGLEGFTGYSAGELVDADLQDLCAPHERNRFLFSNLSKIMETAEFDIDLRRKSGQSFMASITFAPFDHNGVPHLLLVLRDVTSKRVQEGKLRESEERYRKLLAERNELEVKLNRSIKLACLGELAAGIAHEVNNPLGIILGFAQDILDEIGEDNPLFESVKIIELETGRCVGVVKNLLDLARLKPPQITNINLIQLVEDSIALLMPRIKQNKIELKRSFDSDLPSIRVDPQQLQQALLNVMLNAIQAMPYGGELSVAIRLIRSSHPEKERSRVQIVIADTGPGIPEDDLCRIFDPFFSTKGSKGTGLGLAVCQRIVEDHCGKIEIESWQGVGARCTISLPFR